MSSDRETARFWGQLLEYVEAGQVVPIVGRDLLTVRVDARRELLLPSLARRLAVFLEVSAEDLPPGRELNAVACRFLDGPGRPDAEEVYSALKEIAGDLDELAAPEPLVRLAEIQPFRLFVSTTFDPLLERALNQVRFAGEPRTRVLAYSPSSRTDLPADLERLDRPTVFQIAGRLSAIPDYAVTEEDLLEWVHALQSVTRRPNLLFDELARHQLLVVGCSYPDWLARFFIRTAAGDRLSTPGGRIFVADATVERDSELGRFLARFSSRVRIFPGGDAAEFVAQFHQRWSERHPEGFEAPAAGAARGGAGGPEMEPGAVFLSYASEDRAAAELVARALEDAGIDVWFDKSALRAGDDFEDRIRDSIQGCSVFVPLISRRTLTAERRFFRLEWDRALQVAKMAAASERFIVPVSIDDTAPDEQALPSGLRRLHWERLPEGRATPEFVGQVRDLFRQYHKARQGVPA